MDDLFDDNIRARFSKATFAQVTLALGASALLMSNGDKNQKLAAIANVLAIGAMFVAVS